MNVQKEIKLYQTLKGDLTKAVQTKQLSDADGLLQWLKGKLSEEDLRPDTELGFETAEEELAFLKRMNVEQPGLLTSIKQAAARADVPQTTRLMYDLLRRGRTSSGTENGYTEAMPPKAFESYWDFMAYVKGNMCTQVGCTTCGCMPFRKFVETIGWPRIAALLNKVTLKELSQQTDLNWHDALEIMLMRHSSELIEGSVIYKEYLFVFSEYYRLRREEHQPIWKARKQVIEALQKKGETENAV